MSAVAKEAPSRLGALILIWLLSHGGEATPSALTELPNSLGAQRASDDERKRAVGEELAALDKAGHLERRRKVARVLTESGRRAALAALGVTALPEKRDWRAIKKAYLDELPELPRNPAAILARQYKLDLLGGAPTLAQVRDALAWRALGIESAKPFSAREVIEVLFARMGGTAPATAATGTNGALLVPAVPQPVVKRVELPADDATFARHVLAAARASKTGRFGNNKVFISHVLKQLAAEGFAIESDAVKARLVSAHQAGFLSLTRADMVEAMAAEDVNASETAYRNATFHFVRT